MSKNKEHTVVLLLLLHSLIGKIYERQNTTVSELRLPGIVVVSFIRREANVAVSTFQISASHIKQYSQGQQGRRDQ